MREGLLAAVSAVSRGCALMALVLALGACARSNEGAVEMRRAAMSAAGAKTMTPKPNGSSPVGCPAPGAGNLPFDNPCALPLTVKNFSLGRDQQFVPGDHLAISLRTAFIKEFYELASPLRGNRKNGEIAIVANAFEMDGTKEVAFRPSDLKSGRVIYYSDDVEEGQFLNFNNLPIYGPKTYAGHSVAVRLTVFELDVNAEQIKGLLKSLAAIGSIAYAPAAPVLGILNSLGAALASSDQDDTEFRYTMTLDARQGSLRVNNFALEPGNYVIVRKGTRTEDVPWHLLVLNENEGRLYWGPDAKLEVRNTLYRDETYLVVLINKNSGEKSVDLQDNTFDALHKALEEQDKARAAQQAVVSNTLHDALVERAQTDDFNKAKRLLIDARDASSDAIARERLEAVRSMLRRAELTTPEALRDAKRNQIPLTGDQLDYLLSVMASDAITPSALKSNAPLSIQDVRNVRERLGNAL
jgi:hypothetical protein